MVKYRHPALVILFTIITLGIYAIYWLVSTTNELHELKARSAPNPWLILWMLLLSIGGSVLTVFTALGWIPYIAGFVVMIYFYVRYSKAIVEASKGRASFALLIIFWIIFSPVSIILSQIELNKHAKKR